MHIFKVSTHSNFPASKILIVSALEQKLCQMPFCARLIWGQPHPYTLVIPSGKHIVPVFNVFICVITDFISYSFYNISLYLQFCLFTSLFEHQRGPSAGGLEKPPTSWAFQFS